MYHRLLLTCLTCTHFVVSTNAFVVVKPLSRRTGVALTAKYDKQGRHISVDPLDGSYKSVDMNRARECAENFNQCAVEEIEQLKNSKLHLNDMGIHVPDRPFSI